MLGWSERPFSSKNNGYDLNGSIPLRGVHVSVYDKNPEEHVCPTVVPDDVIASQSDKYWAPNPQTGVFGPETDHNPTAGSPSTASVGEDSVLEQKAFFRPLEDLDKPPHP
ncbi:unnamed protein product [Fraxinus pennsylvanica]|uniref:Late embryogenesis abundant protein n=1 Tax=Fraxinus pennsylvanica TaxID=56036 RepID=A0AAD2DXV4_9LAMI|nr:unnamed protein product [Fraxinus pennsylvanica]